VNNTLPSALAIFLFANAAMAQVIDPSEQSPAVIGVASITEFLGQFTESFEGFTYRDLENPSGQVNVSRPVEILGGQAVLSARHALNLEPLFVWSTIGGFSLDDLGQDEGHVVALPHHGLQGIALNSINGVNPVGRIDFAQPIARFGGYWHHAVTRQEAGPVTVRFLGASDSLVDQAQFNYDYAGLRGTPEWFGWSSSRPIHAIEFTGFWASVDGLQVDAVPEPGSMYVLFGAIAAVSSFRNRAHRLRRPQG
jgi:hypothetical protein